MCKWNNCKTLMINGRVRDIDSCIYDLVKALNQTGFETIASCCGHNHRPGNIILKDGRELFIVPDFKTGRKLDKLIGVDIHGENVKE